MLIDGKPLTGKDAIQYFNLKKETLKKLGLQNYVVKNKFKDIKQIFESDTGMVVGQCIKDCSLDINGKVPLTLKNGEAYVMPLNHFVHGYKNKDKNNIVFKPYRKTFTELFNRYKGQDLKGKKILISRTGGLGDLIVTQSVIKAIKHFYPDCHVTYATTPAFTPLFNSFPKGLIDGIAGIPYNQKLLKEHNYHMLFIHAIENCVDTQKDNYYEVFKKVSCLDYDPKEFVSELIPLKEITQQLKQFNAVKNNTILFHMLSTTALRSYPMNNWINLIKILNDRGYKIGIIDHKDKHDEIEKFVAGSGFDSEKVYSLAKYSETISHGIALFDLCIGGVTIDSTFAHVAGGLKKPAVTICGPYGAHNVVGYYDTVAGIERHPEWNLCGKAPCHLNGQQHLCPFVVANQSPGCQASIEPIRIADLLEEQLKKFGK